MKHETLTLPEQVQFLAMVLCKLCSELGHTHVADYVAEQFGITEAVSQPSPSIRLKQESKSV